MNQNIYKKDFPIFKNRDICFLDSGASSQKPDVVINEMIRFYTNDYANIHRGMYELSEISTELYENSRENVAKYINANPNEIIFTKGATESINLVSTVLDKSILTENDEVLVSISEHHANFVSWQNTKAVFKVFNITDDGEMDIIDLKAKLSKNTKVVAFSAMSNVLGIINPVKEIIKEIRAFNPNILILVDGSQAIAHERIDVKDFDADFFVFSGHKIYGPSGIGVLYGKYEILEKLPPYQYGGDMVKKVSVEKTTFAPPPARFEAGTPPIAEAIGLGVAIDYFEKTKGFNHSLYLYLEKSLKSIDGLRILGKSKNKTAIASFVIEGISASDIGTLLAEQNIAVRVGHHCAEPLINFLGYKSVVRCSLGIYNDEKDVDKLIAGLIKIKGLFKK